MSLTDKQIREVCTEWRKGMIGRKKSYLRCAEVSYSLQGYLSYLGQPTKLVTGNAPKWADVGNHVWLKLPDGRVIDLTADQFDAPGMKFPKVYIGKALNIHKEVKRTKG